MPKRKKFAKKQKEPLDTFSAKRARGRPPRMRFSEIRGRAGHFRWILNEVWDRLLPPLSAVQTEEDVIKAFQEGASPYERYFVPGMAALVLQVLRDPKFPKRRTAQANFLADSLAGVGLVSPRRSRDIAAEERAQYRAKTKHHIIRYEFYIECSCGYRGPARDNVCRKCSAEIPPSLGGLPGRGLF
jgi:hypothetical protein